MDQQIFMHLPESGLYIPTQNELTLREKNKNSIAVLLFHNTSSEKELDYICDGIAEEIIDSLSKSKDLFVTARSSSFMFRNKEISILDTNPNGISPVSSLAAYFLYVLCCRYYPDCLVARDEKLIQELMAVIFKNIW